MTIEKPIDLLRCALLQLAFSQPEPIAPGYRGLKR